VEFAGADIGEIMTDTAEGNLDEKCLISISHDRASYQSRGDQWAERPSPEGGTRIRDKTGQNQFEF